MVWISRSGERLGNVGKPGVIVRPMLSPDQKSVAYDVLEGQGGDVWVHDLARNGATRISFNPQSDFFPVWSPDSSSIAFGSLTGGQSVINMRKASGVGATESLLQTPRRTFLLDWSDTAGAILFSEVAPKTRLDISVLPLRGDRKPIPVLQSEFNEQSGVFSPDGKFLAYVSDESGRAEVYVQTYPLSGAKWQVSVNGGLSPRWRGDGRELYFLSDGAMMAAGVTPGADFRIGTPSQLFSLGMRTDYQAMGERFSVSADGQRFLLALPVESEAGASAATIVLNALDRPEK